MDPIEFTEDEVRYAVVLVTAPSAESAQEIARALVGEGLAACVNLVEGVFSVFKWKGKLEEDKEVLLIVKTRTENLPDLISRVKELHSYDVPEVIALPVIEGNPAYLQWIDEVT